MNVTLNYFFVLLYLFDDGPTGFFQCGCFPIHLKIHEIGNFGLKKQPHPGFEKVLMRNREFF
jgi:hypothetical protein